MKTFSVGEVVRESWALFKKSWQSLYTIFAVLFALNFGIAFVAAVFQQSAPAVSMLVQLVSWVVSVVVTLGFIKVLLAIVDEGKGEVEQLFFAIKDFKLMLKYLATSVIIGFVFLGLIMPFLVVGGIGTFVMGSQNAAVPGLWIILALLMLPAFIYVSIRFQFWLYALVDKSVWGFDALKKSWEITKGAVLKIILFACVVLGINILGLLCLIVGLFVTIPLTTLAAAVLYRKLQSRS